MDKDRRASYIIQILYVENLLFCPVRTLKALQRSRPLSPQSPLFATDFLPYSQIIDTHIRDALQLVLSILNISTVGHGFHTFRRSVATLAFDNNISLQNIMTHGLWCSSAIWTYLQNASHAASTMPSTFASIILVWLGVFKNKFHIFFKFLNTYALTVPFYSNM